MADPQRPLDPIETRWRETEDGHLDREFEERNELFDDPEPYEGNPYDGTDQSDRDFWEDRDWGDEA